MLFEVSERIPTGRDRQTVLALLEEQLTKIAEKVNRQGETLEVRSIEASFGSINRHDVTTVELRPAEDGFMAVASVKYRPSVAFWIIFVITLFTWVLWLVPIAFYLMQKKTVRSAIQEVFTRARHEFQSSTHSIATGGNSQAHPTYLVHLEKLAQLRDKGVITEEEFQDEKRKVLDQ